MSRVATAQVPEHDCWGGCTTCRDYDEAQREQAKRQDESIDWDQMGKDMEREQREREQKTFEQDRENRAVRGY